MVSGSMNAVNFGHGVKVIGRGRETSVPDETSESHDCADGRRMLGWVRKRPVAAQSAQVAGNIIAESPDAVRKHGKRPPRLEALKQAGCRMKVTRWWPFRRSA